MAETLAGFMFLQFFSFENRHKLKTYFISELNPSHFFGLALRAPSPPFGVSYQKRKNKMDSIQNNLKPEIKEEIEEEKIDIENHFHPVISSCKEDQLTRSVC